MNKRGNVTKGKARKVRCSSCGKLFDRKDVYEIADPYIREVWNREEIGIFCNGCYSDRAESV